MLAYNECDECPAGKFSSPSKDTCYDCQIGKYSTSAIVFVVVIGSVSYLNSEYDFIRYVQKILPIVSLLVLSGLTFTDLKLKELFEKINFDSDFSKSTF